MPLLRLSYFRMYRKDIRDKMRGIRAVKSDGFPWSSWSVFHDEVRELAVDFSRVSRF